MIVTITGAQANGRCDCCGRILRTAIEIDHGNMIGADCLRAAIKPEWRTRGRNWHEWYTHSAATLRDLAKARARPSWQARGYSAAAFRLDLRGPIAWRDEQPAPGAPAQPRLL